MKKKERKKKGFFLTRIILNGTEIIAEILPGKCTLSQPSAKFYTQFFLQLTR